MKIKLLTIFISIIFACISCTFVRSIKSAKKLIMQDERYFPKITLASILEKDTILGRDSIFYFCYSHYSSNIVGYKRIKTRKICTCELLYPAMIDIILEDNLIRRGVLPSCQYILFYDSTFVSDYILPLFIEVEDREKIEYTLLNATDSTFKNVIDFEHKMIINKDAYYYPIKSEYIVSVSVNLEWFKSVVPKEKWIYNQSCYNEHVSMFLLIPLLKSGNE